MSMNYAPSTDFTDLKRGKRGVLNTVKQCEHCSGSGFFNIQYIVNGEDYSLSQKCTKCDGLGLLKLKYQIVRSCEYKCNKTQAHLLTEKCITHWNKCTDE